MRTNFDNAVGLNDSHIDYDSLSAPVHVEIVKPFLELRAQADAANFSIAIVSGYRSFERQLSIWNQKAEGKRPVLDSYGQVLDVSQLSPWERVQALLRWSALPGTSRHHWGTDIDIYDSAAVASDYQVELTPREVADNGPFGAMHGWLDQQIAAGSAAGFFRPYDRDWGGIAPERWHLSYRPVAIPLQQQLTVAAVRSLLRSQPLCLKESVLSHLEEIFERFVRVPDDADSVEE